MKTVLRKLEARTFFLAMILAVILEGLFGALLLLICRVTAMLTPPRCWTESELMFNRPVFASLWCLAIARVAMQGLLFLLGNVSAAS